ncbi:MAG: ABC transporter substrate-binding protein [Acetobacteraceae bacterium]
MDRRPAPARHALARLFGLAALAATLIAGAMTPTRAQDQAKSNTNATLIYFDAVGNLTLDPREPQNNSSFAQGPMMALYDALIYLTPKGEPSPGLAESWKYNADLTELTLKLRPGVTFHDGSKLDASVVAKNFEKASALGTRAGFATSEAMGAITGVETKGDDIVILKLKAPNGQMPFLLGAQPGMMIAAASLDADGFGATLKPVGTGPYKVRSFESNVRTVMDRYDGYWGGTAGRPAAIEHHFVPDGRARLNAVRSGQSNLSIIDARTITEAKQAGMDVLINEKNSTWDFYLNVKRTNIGNLKVRQAFMHALDRQAIADALGFGASQPTAQLFSKSSPVYDPALDQLYPYDPDKAKKLLAEGGYPNGVDITWLLLNTTEYKLIAEAVQAMMAEVGIRLKFDVIDTSQFTTFRRPPTRGDIMMARWGGRPDPLQAFQEVAVSGGSVNAGDAAVPEIDVLAAKAKAMDPNSPERMAVIKQLNRLTTEVVSHFGLMTRSQVYAYKPGCISGLPPYLPTGNDRINDVRIAANCK